MTQPDSSGASPRLPDRYEFLRTIGGGGLGRVYMARDTVLDRVVAIKTVQQQDDRVQALLMREARLLRSLDHPGVVSVHEVVVADDLVFVVQDYIDGQPLGRWQQTAPLPAILRVYEQLATTLAHLHERGLAHRDLKPSNVLVRKADGAPVIIDFGLAVRSREADSLTHVGSTVIGTPGYMAPEVIAGRESAAPADVFALGIMLAEAIARRAFWQQGSMADILTRRIRQTPADVLATVPEVEAAGLAPLVASMMANDPAERPAAAAVAAAIAARESPAEPVLARPGPEPAPAAAPTARARTRSIWPLAGLLAAGAVVAAGAVLTRSAAGGGFVALVFSALIVAGGGLAIAAAVRRRAARRGRVASVRAVAHRISAIEAQVAETGEMTRTLALAIDNLGQQLSPERLQEVIRQTVIVALREMQPAPDAERDSRRVQQLLAPQPRRFADRIKEYGGMVGGGLTAAIGLVGLLGNMDVWRPNRPPEIVRFGSDTDRLRRGYPFALPVEARDEDGDELTFEWKASAGRVEGSGAATMWLPPADLSERVVSLTLTVSDGWRAVTRTRTIRVNQPPQGAIVVDGDVRPGRVVRLMLAGSDSDGDALQHNWVVSSGSLAQSSGAMVLWTVPAQAAEAQAICHLSDGFESVSVARVIPIAR